MEWFWPFRETEETTEVVESSSDSEETEPENDENIYKVRTVIFDLYSRLINMRFWFQPAEKLDMLTDYLRTTYCFCHWCGTQYDGISDLKENCPGEKLDDH